MSDYRIGSLLRFGLYQALRLQAAEFHVGFMTGDADLAQANPLYLLDFLRQSGTISIVLLHCYPYEREGRLIRNALQQRPS